MVLIFSLQIFQHLESSLYWKRYHNYKKSSHKASSACTGMFKTNYHLTSEFSL